MSDYRNFTLYRYNLYVGTCMSENSNHQAIEYEKSKTDPLGEDASPVMEAEYEDKPKADFPAQESVPLRRGRQTEQDAKNADLFNDVLSGTESHVKPQKNIFSLILEWIFTVFLGLVILGATALLGTWSRKSVLLIDASSLVLILETCPGFARVRDRYTVLKEFRTYFLILATVLWYVGMSMN